MDQESTERLYDFSRSGRVTPNSVVQAAWALLLAKYNDTDDVVFGFAVTGRSSGITNFENTVGMFVNSMPMRIKCDGSTSLYDWVQEIQQHQMDLIQHEHSSLQDIQEASELPANSGMFDSLLVYQNAPKLTLSAIFRWKLKQTDP